MSRCKGKLETGERCGIHAAPKRDLCTACEARGAQLYDKTVQAPTVLRAHDLKPGKILCGREGCGYGVKKEGDFCKKHQEPVTIPVEDQKRGLDDGPKLPRQTPFYTVSDPAETVTSDNKLPNVLHFAPTHRHTPACSIPVVVGVYSTADWAEVTCVNCLLWKPMSDGAHSQTDTVSELKHVPAASLNENAADPIICGECNQMQFETCSYPPARGAATACTFFTTKPQISPTAFTPPQEQVSPSAIPRKGLAALIAVTPALSTPPVGLHIPFTSDELAILAEQEVTPEVIRQFVTMGLEQQLRPVVDEEDPLAKSRIRPEGE